MSKVAIAIGPDAMLAGGSGAAQALQRLTRTVPIVFANVVDPVGGGIVASLNRPGGNITGFTQFEYSISAKWLELLKRIVPGLTRAAVIRDPTLPGGTGQFGAIQSAAPSFGVELQPIDSRDASKIEQDITAFSGPNCGLIVIQAASAIVNRKVIITLAAQHQLPAIYAYPLFVTDGGLIAYGPDSLDGYRRAAVYIDRILKGEKPADLPVQAPTKYELAINLKTARALGLSIPPTLLVTADEVIE
jgi:putative tryptophan/tyrosine transport system substrate-binding protein